MGSFTRLSTGEIIKPNDYSPETLKSKSVSQKAKRNTVEKNTLPDSSVKPETSEADTNWGRVLGGTVVQGADQFVNSLLSTGSMIEGLTTKPIEKATGIENFAALGPWATLSRFMKNVQEENQTSYQPDFESAGKAGEILDKYGTATVAAVPQAALALLTAGSSLGAQGASAGLQTAGAAASSGLASTVGSAVSNVAKNPQFWTSFSQIAGPAYDQAKADGADDLEATSYAMLTGLVNSAVEIGGGLETLPANLQQAAKGGNSALRLWVKGMLEEGKEEVVQGAISQLSQTLYGKQNPIFSTTDPNAVLSPSRAAEEFTGGAVVGGILGGGQIAAGKAIDYLGRQNTTAPPSQSGTTQTETASPILDTSVQENGPETDVQPPVVSEPVQPAPVQTETVSSVGPEDILVQIARESGRRSYNSFTQAEQSMIAGDLFENGQVGVDAQNNVFQQFSDQHIDNRTPETVGQKNVNAFQYDWPMLQQFTREAANQLIADADTSLQAPVNRRYERTTMGKKFINEIMDTPSIRQAMNMGLTRGDIITAAENLIQDKGSENNAAAKRLEIVVDDMLTNGYTDIEGNYHAPNQEYIQLKSNINGAKGDYSVVSEELPIWDMNTEVNRLYQPQQEAPAAPQTEPQTAPTQYDNLGSARRGFTEQGMEGVERTSKLAESMPYNKTEEAATALTKEDYDKIFRYRSQTEARSMNLAEELVYYLQDGKRTFIRDISEPQYQALVRALDEAPAWNAPMMDAAHMIQTELQGRSANADITSEEYVDFLEMMRRHETSTGQGVQAGAKWTRADNQTGSSSELDAWNNLERSNLSDQQKAQIFQRIVKWDNQIEAVPYGDTQALKDIILEIGRERGVLNGVFGNQSALLENIASKSLDGLDFDQLKQFAYASTEAMSLDSNPVNIGQKIKTVQVLNMLSSPITPARNLTGNTSFYGVDTVAMDVSALLDMALSRITGTRSVAFDKSPVSLDAYRAAAKAAQLSAAEVTLDVDMGNGTNRYGTGGKRTFKADGNFVDRVLSSLERNQGYLLQTSDEFFKGLAKSTEADTQKLIDQGKIQTENKNYASEQAQQLARYRTFQDDSRISVAIQQIHDVLNLVGFGDSGRTIKGKTVKSFGPGDIVAPFTKVAGNLVSRSAEYSPYNAVKGTVETAKVIADAARGKTISPETQAKAVSDFGRGATGTAIAMGFMLLAKAGLLRQADDEGDENVKALNQSEGIQGTQLNISAAERWLNGQGGEWKSGDTLVDLSSIEPLNFLMNLGTEMAKKDQNPIVSSFNAATGSILDASSELPVMGFIGDTANDVVRYGQPIEESLANSAAYTVTSSVIPNALRAIAKGTDDRPRNLYAGDSFVDDVVSNIKNSIPGLRKTLPGSVNSFGEEKTYGTEPGWQFFNSVFNPTGVNTYTQGEVSQELERLRGQTGETSFYPTKSIPSELSYTLDSGKKITKELTYEERQDFQRQRGTLSQDTMAAMINSSAYRSGSEEDKAALLNRCEEYAYETAKQDAMAMKTAPEWVNNARTARQDVGISTEEYLAYYEQYGSALSGASYENVKEAVKNGFTIPEYMAYKEGVSGLTSDKDENGNTISGSKKEKVLEAIDSMDLSDSEKDWLYYLNNYSEKTIDEAPWRSR